MKLSFLFSGSLILSSIGICSSLEVIQPTSTASATTTTNSYEWQPDRSNPVWWSDKIGIHQQIKT